MVPAAAGAQPGDPPGARVDAGRLAWSAFQARFVTPDGREAAYLADGADEQIGVAYARTIADEIRSLL